MRFVDPERKIATRILRLFQQYPGKEFSIQDVCNGLGSCNPRSVKTQLSKMFLAKELNKINSGSKRPGIYFLPLPQTELAETEVVDESLSGIRLAQEGPIETRIALPPRGTTSKLIEDVASQIRELENRVADYETQILQLTEQIEEKDLVIKTLRENESSSTEFLRNLYKQLSSMFLGEKEEVGAPAPIPFDPSTKNYLES